MRDVLDAAIDDELRARFAAARDRAGELDESYVALWNALEAQSHGGKRVRPRLVDATYRGFGGRDTEASTRVGVAFELLHTAFLVHDDLLDHDTVRRGAPNVTGTFIGRARLEGRDAATEASWGETAAVLAGDLALSMAHREIALLHVGRTERGALLDLLDDAVFFSAAGELADVLDSGATEKPEMARVLTTLERKTAVYSFECPLAAGAVLAGASAEAIRVLRRFGQLVGIAFQISDDVLGVFGDPDITGKSVDADLREGTHSTLLAAAATTPHWPYIAARIGRDIDAAKADEVREALRDCGAVDEAMRIAREHVTLASLELDSSEIPETLRTELRSLAARAIDRVA